MYSGRLNWTDPVSVVLTWFVGPEDKVESDEADIERAEWDVASCMQTSDVHDHAHSPMTSSPSDVTAHRRPEAVIGRAAVRRLGVESHRLSSA